MKIVAFTPIRLNSKRVVGKNMRMLGKHPLLYYILQTLLKVKNIDEIYAYCSSDKIVEQIPDGVKFLQRSANLDKDTTLGAEIYDAFINQVDADIYILAHTTSPFIKVETVENALQKVISGEYDSAFSAEKIQTFAWYSGKPINYSLKSIPRTQDLEPVFVETSAFFIFKKNVWTDFHQRIGNKPYIAVVDKIEGVDIDNETDFAFAEKILNENR